MGRTTVNTMNPSERYIQVHGIDHLLEKRAVNYNQKIKYILVLAVGIVAGYVLCFLNYRLMTTMV